MTIRVMMYTTVEPGEEDTFRAAYLEVAETLRGTPGLLRDELLLQKGTQRFCLQAEWSSLPEFLAWVEDPKHTDKTAPIVPYLERNFDRELYEVMETPYET